MGQATGNSYRVESSLRPATWWPLIRFAVCVAFIGLALSLLALPWAGLPWWKVFRRCISIASAISLWLCIKKFEGRPFLTYGFSVTREGRRDFRFGLFLGLGTIGLLFAIGLISGAYRIDITEDHFRLWRTVVGFIPLAVLVGVLEELVFRGFIFQHLLKSSKLLAIAVSSGLYAVVHLKSTTFTLATSLELGGLSLLGSILAISYLRTQQLSLAIGLHAALAYGARVNKLLIEFPDPALAWLFGTNRLVNGVMSWLLLLGACGIVMWRSHLSQQSSAAASL